MHRSTLTLASSLLFTAVLGPFAPLSALGAGGGGVGGEAASSGSVASSSSASSSSGGAVCKDDGLCEVFTEDCTCADCKTLAMCVPDQCVNDGVCDLKDACICADCRHDQFCSNPAHCK